MSDDTARTWRDLADQLTPEQIARLERVEREDVEFWLKCARHYAENNTIRNIMDVPHPPDAELPAFGHVMDGEFVQTFEGTHREVPDIGIGRAGIPQLPDEEYPETAARLGAELVIVGSRHTDGATNRRILLVSMVDLDEWPDFVPDDCTYEASLDEAVLDADGARRLGQALIDAADEIDGLLP